MSVLVIGATGNIGQRVVSALLARDASPVAFVRAGERDKPPSGVLADERVRLAYGDLGQPETVVEAARGCESVFVVTPHSPNQVELQMAAVDAAAEVGARVVKVSSWGPAVYDGTPVPGAQRHWITQQKIIERGVPYTFLNPNYFMQVLINRYAKDVRRRGILISPAGDRGISMVHAADVAEVAAVTLTDDSHVGQTYVLSGPTAPRYTEIAEMLTEITGHPVSYYDIPEPEFDEWMRSENRQPWETAHAAGIFALYREGIGELVTDDVEKVTGRPPRHIRDFLQSVKDQFMPDPA